MVDKRVRWATDIGGTFTDIVVEIDGQPHTRKVLTTPQAPERAVIDGSLAFMSDLGISPKDVDIFVHGTTLATNAILERRGARCALICTQGFRDILTIADEGRFDQYDIFIDKTRPLIDRELTYTVPERVGADGRVLLHLDHAAVDAVISEIDKAGVKSVAVCLMHSYANPEHEQWIAQRVIELHPNWFVSISSEVCPEVREYERCSTTVANAYVKPIMASYLRRLEKELAERGFNCPTYLMTSGGGLTTLTTASEFPIRLVESGPAGGAILAAHAASQCEEAHVLAFDMGGTTAKVCFIDNHQPHTSRTFEVDRAARYRKGSGLPLRIPVIDMVEIGAGGGSLCGIDALGHIQVGPESASSVPGPACYPDGGERPTVTDANLILGRLDPDNFAGGRIRLRTDAASAAMQRVLADSLSCTASLAAFGVAQTVEENMANAARVHASECGKDLEKCAMVAFGGAAPLHAVSVAKKLGIGKIILPPNAGVGSAVGFLLAPIKYEIVRSYYMTLSAFDGDKAEALLNGMRLDAARVISAGVAQEQITVARGAFMRYVGQGHEVFVQLPAQALTAQAANEIRARFEAAYRALFGRIIPNANIEIITWNVTVSGPEQRSAPLPATAASRAAGASSYRKLFDADATNWLDASVYWRPDLQKGDYFHGPAILAEEATSMLVPSGYRAVATSGDYVVVEKMENE